MTPTSPTSPRSPRHSSPPKQRSSLMAIGGFVVGASAMAALLGLHDVLQKDEAAYLRGGYSSSTTPDVDAVPSPVPTSPALANGGTAGVTTLAPSPAPSTPNNSPYPTFVDTAFPTHLPTLDASYSPTTEREGASDMMFSHFILRSKEVGIRLKLYWEQGYFWQEEEEERWWCMACPGGTCKRSDKMELRNCKKKSDKDATFVVKSYGDKGHQFRVANTNLCLQKMGDRRAIKLKPCKRDNSLQRFVDFEAEGKFDLRPVGYTNTCLTNHHHPKAGEEIYAETCKKAHRTDTGYWVAY